MGFFYRDSGFVGLRGDGEVASDSLSSSGGSDSGCFGNYHSTSTASFVKSPPTSKRTETGPEAASPADDKPVPQERTGSESSSSIR